MILPFGDFVAPPTKPAMLPLSAIVSTRIHAAVGATALIFGLFVMLRGNGLLWSARQTRRTRSAAALAS